MDRCNYVGTGKDVGIMVEQRETINQFKTIKLAMMPPRLRDVDPHSVIGI